MTFDFDAAKSTLLGILEKESFSRAVDEVLSFIERYGEIATSLISVFRKGDYTEEELEYFILKMSHIPIIKDISSRQKDSINFTKQYFHISKMIEDLSDKSKACINVDMSEKEIGTGLLAFSKEAFEDSLQEAIDRHDTSAVKKLLLAGESPNSLIFKINAIDYSKEQKAEDIYKLLESEGARFSSGNKTHENSYDIRRFKTTIHSPLSTDIIKDYKSKKEFIKFDKMATNELGLIIADLMKSGDEETVMYLLGFSYLDNLVIVEAVKHLLSENKTKEAKKLIEVTVPYGHDYAPLRALLLDAAVTLGHTDVADYICEKGYIKVETGVSLDTFRYIANKGYRVTVIRSVISRFSLTDLQNASNYYWKIKKIIEEITNSGAINIYAAIDKDDVDELKKQLKEKQNDTNMFESCYVSFLEYAKIHNHQNISTYLESDEGKQFNIQIKNKRSRKIKINYFESDNEEDDRLDRLFSNVISSPVHNIPTELKFLYDSYQNYESNSEKKIKLAKLLKEKSYEEFLKELGNDIESKSALCYVFIVSLYLDDPSGLQFLFDSKLIDKEIITYSGGEYDLLWSKSFKVTPLRIACIVSKVSVFDWLVKHGARINVDPSSTNKKRAFTPKTFMSKSLLFLAIESGNAAVANYLIRNNIQFDQDEASECLVAAVENGYTNIARYLISKGADITATSKTDGSLFITAAARGHTELMKICEVPKSNVQSGFEHSLKTGNISGAKYLINKVQINQDNALFYIECAISSESAKTIRFALDNIHISGKINLNLSAANYIIKPDVYKEIIKEDLTDEFLEKMFNSAINHDAFWMTNNLTKYIKHNIDIIEKLILKEIPPYINYRVNLISTIRKVISSFDFNGQNKFNGWGYGDIKDLPITPDLIQELIKKGCRNNLIVFIFSICIRYNNIEAVRIFLENCQDQKFLIDCRKLDMGLINLLEKHKKSIGFNDFMTRNPKILDAILEKFTDEIAASKDSLQFIGMLVSFKKGDQVRRFLREVLPRVDQMKAKYIKIFIASGVNFPSYYLKVDTDYMFRLLRELIYEGFSFEGSNITLNELSLLATENGASISSISSPVPASSLRTMFFKGLPVQQTRKLQLPVFADSIIFQKYYPVIYQK